MATTTVTSQNFGSVVSKGLVLLDFWAPWCGPCRTFAPVFEAASAKHPDVVFGKVNTEDQPALAGQFSISAIPTLMLIKDGVVLYAQPGMVNGRAIDALLDKARTTDVEAIRKKHEATRANA